MAAKELIMLDEHDENDIDDNEFISLILSEGCNLTRNILSIPRAEALGYATNILVQLEIGEGK